LDILGCYGKSKHTWAKEKQGEQKQPAEIFSGPLGE